MLAFRRGIDRRAYVLARAQCGDKSLVQSALMGLNDSFNAEYAALPIAQWPIRFWTLLLSRKELAQGQSPWPALASISHGPRAALLLRLVAGLDFAHAAQVLNISEETYRFALERGLEQLHGAGFDFKELERLRDSFFEEVKQLPPDFIPPTPLPAPEAHAMPELVFAEKKAVEKKSKPWLWIGAVLFLLVLAAAGYTWYAFNKTPVVLAAPLMVNDIQEAVIHPDYEVIAEPAIQERVKDLAFLSWLAAGAPEESFEVLKSGEISKPAPPINEADSESQYEN